MTKRFTALADMTPEEIQEHMEDQQWGEVFEALQQECLEDGGNAAIEVAYAINSMFVQSSQLAVFIAQLQEELQQMFEQSSLLVEALEAADPDNQALANYKSWMFGDND